jgi:hypothetical protein
MAGRLFNRIYVAKNYKTGRDHLLAGLKAFVKAGESEADT